MHRNNSCVNQIESDSLQFCRCKVLRRIAVLVLCVTVIFSIHVFAEGKNIVRNPGFEDGNGNIPEGWSVYNWNSQSNVTLFRIDSGQSHNGGRSACIINNSLNDARYTQEIAVEPDSYYRLSCWIKTEGVEIEGKGANLSILGTLYRSRSIYGTSSGWEYVELYGKTGSDQKSFVITVGLGGYGGESTGKAWFDDVLVEKVDSVPEGIGVVNLYPESGSSNVSGGRNGHKVYGSGMIWYTVIFVLILCLCYYYMKSKKIKIKYRDEKALLCLILGAGLVLRLILASAVEGFPSDIACFKAWALEAAKDLPGFYTSGIFCDYPPFYIYILFIVGKLASIPWLNPYFTLLVRLPSMMADLVTAYILYRAAKRHLPEAWELLLAAAYAFNPAVLLNSTLWGQVDSFFTMMIVSALILLRENRTGASSAMLCAAVLMKPQGIFFLPVLLFELLKRKEIKPFINAAIAGLMTALAVILPFSFNQRPLWILKLYMNTASGYTNASLNAFNLFSLLGANLKDDSEIWFLFSYRTWGLVLAVILVIFTGFLYLKGRHVSLPFIAGLLLNAGAFVLVSRMHERYMFPVIALVLLCFVHLKDRRLGLLFVSMTVLVFLNSHVVLSRVLNTGNPHIPPNDFLLRAASLVNVLLFAGLVKVAYDMVIKGKIIPVFANNPAKGLTVKSGMGSSDKFRAKGTHKLMGNSMDRMVNPRVKALHIDGRDILIMAGMTLVYLIVSIINLGGFEAPNTSWQPAIAGESFTIDLGKEADISRIYYYYGINDRIYDKGSYRIEFIDGSGTSVASANISEGDIYAWEHIKVAAKARWIKVSANAPGKTLNELVIVEKGSRKSLEGIRIVEKQVHPEDRGTVENLFDEQHMFEYERTLRTSTYFDEIYHARTAYEHIHRIEPYESTHPPLGKIFIALGILIAGMNPFGWRIAGVLFGAAMIPVMYIFGKKMFEERFYAFCAAFLIMFDFMHFVQSRIATIDTYGVFFIILMYYYMYDYYVNKSYALGYRRSLKSLFFCGLFFGLGAASKWIAIYGAAGLAFLFFLTKYEEYGDYRLLTSDRRYREVPWLKQFFSHYIIRTMAFCILFFIAIPAAIYLMSYIPFMMVPGPGHGLKDVFTYQVHMYKYHANLTADHSFKSSWWSWPIIWKPIWFYAASDLPEGRAASIVSMGNPAIWWAGIAAVAAAVLISVKNRDRKMIPVFVAMLSQYLPWIPVDRVTFIYHFYAVVPFMILAMVYVIKHLIEKNRDFKYGAWAYLFIAGVLFAMFYPVLSGMEVDRTYIDNYLRWFKDRWYF